MCIRNTMKIFPYGLNSRRGKEFKTDYMHNNVASKLCQEKTDVQIAGKITKVFPSFNYNNLEIIYRYAEY